MRLSILALCMAVAMAASADTKHEVQRGETIYGIAYKYHVTADQLLQWNPQAQNGVKKGMVLTIKDGSLEQDQTERPRENTPVKESISVKEVKQDKAAEAKIAGASALAVPSERVPEAKTDRMPVREATSSKVYVAQKGDNFAKIAGKTGVSVGELIDYNPFIDPARVKEGQHVRLSDDAPLNGGETEEASSPQNEVIGGSVADKQEAAPIYGVGELGAPIAPVDGEYEEEIVEEPSIAAGKHNILVLLPFMAAEEQPGRQASYYADFYRGLLMAAHELANNPGNTVEIITLDTNGDIAQLERQLRLNIGRDVAVVIAPEDEAQLLPIIKQAEENSTFVLNAFNFKDNSYLTSPVVLQANIDQGRMYAKAIDGMMQTFRGYTPVVLRDGGERKEKEPFVNAMRKRYAEAGLPVVELDFENALTPELVAERLDSSGRYVFIPLSGHVSVFNKFASALERVHADALNPNDYVLFGYPDWTAFKGESQAMLYKLGAVIYSRVYFNEEDQATRKVQNEFEDWYGSAPIEVVPNQAILGYDTGKFLISSLQRGDLAEALDGPVARGVQSAAAFEKVSPEGGYINNSLFLIRFNRDHTCRVEVLAGDN